MRFSVVKCEVDSQGIIMGATEAIAKFANLGDALEYLEGYLPSGAIRLAGNGHVIATKPEAGEELIFTEATED